jgi:hypothetical protein
MTPPDVRSEWTIGCIVNLQDSVEDRKRGDGSTSYASRAGTEQRGNWEHRCTAPPVVREGATIADLRHDARPGRNQLVQESAIGSPSAA